MESNNLVLKSNQDMFSIVQSAQKANRKQKETVKKRIRKWPPQI